MSPKDPTRPSKDPEKFVHDENRGAWGNKTEFILSVLGYAIGIGNVWRFPYLCYRNGGGAFLVLFILMLCLAGIPLFFMEVVIGQFSSTGCLSMFRMCPLFKGAGFAIVIINILCCIYYIVIISYPVLFLIKLISPVVPWQNCNNPWNTDKCFMPGNETAGSLYAASANGTNSAPYERGAYRTPADEFFHREILQISTGIEDIGGIVWPLFGCLVFSWVVVYLCIIKGVKTVGKVVYFTALFPFLILFVLFIRGVTLPGAIDGIIYYIKPDFNRLMDLKVWADAAIQMCFSVGPGWGGIVSMASFNEFHNNAMWDSVFITLINVSTSIFAGFVVFSVLGYLSLMTGIPVENVATQGPGLAFVTYPEAINLMPAPHLWAALFFSMLFFLGLDSMFVQIEAIINSLVDDYATLRAHKTWVTLGSCVVMFFLSISMVTNGGIFVLSLMDYYAVSVAVIGICFVEAIVIGWIYGTKRFSSDVAFMVGKKPPKFFIVCWKYITPIILAFIFIATLAFSRRVTFNEIEYPDWSIVLGWALCFSSLICIPIYMLYKLCSSKGSLKDRFFGSLIAKDWFPANPEICQKYEMFLKEENIELY